jgi:hypothetical protein
MRVGNLAVLRDRETVLHRSVAEPDQRKVATEAGLVEIHGFGAVALE